MFTGFRDSGHAALPSILAQASGLGVSGAVAAVDGGADMGAAGMVTLIPVAAASRVAPGAIAMANPTIPMTVCIPPRKAELLRGDFRTGVAEFALKKQEKKVRARRVAIQ